MLKIVKMSRYLSDGAARHSIRSHTEHCQQVLFFAHNYPPYARASGNYRCPGLLKSARITPCVGVRQIVKNFNMETLNQNNRSFNA